MCLYWPEYHVAINIVDDPYSPDFEPNQDPKCTVYSVSCKQIYDQEFMIELARQLSAHMGINQDFDYDDPVWRAKNKRLMDELMCGIF